ncbi:hypothetical protein G6F43_008239 [Rhizopus delemar]|nr:hypothetical protein G6F43_008239 [Rhizopus delemar]
MSSLLSLKHNENNTNDSFKGDDSPPYRSRYNDRYKSLLINSPLRDPFEDLSKRTITTCPSTSEKKIKPTYNEEYTKDTLNNEDQVKEVEIKEKVSSKEIHSDQRHTESKAEFKQKAIEKEIHSDQKQARNKLAEIKQRIINKEMHSEKRHAKISQIEQKKLEPEVPHYMQGTRAFENRLSSKKEEQKRKNVLKPCPGGGITKRVGTSKIPKYKSTTTINAIEDIKNEMLPEDTYVSMAERIKLFEKGLGNGSNKPPVPRPMTTNPNLKKAKRDNTDEQSIASQASTRSKSTQSSEKSNAPSYARGTISTLSRSNTITKEDRNRQGKQVEKKEQKLTEFKPFRFATSERAQHHEEAFKEKLKLWKSKEAEQASQQQNKRGSKRKFEDDSEPASRKKRS